MPRIDVNGETYEYPQDAWLLKAMPGHPGLCAVPMGLKQPGDEPTSHRTPAERRAAQKREWEER